jgi:membrane fusion protein, copper/silver efflux system
MNNRMSHVRNVALAMTVVGGLFISYQLGGHYSEQKVHNPTARHPLYYVDPMHPSYKSDRPGIAPDCGMKLVAVYAENIGDTPSAIPAGLHGGAVRIDGARQQLLGIRVAQVQKSAAVRVIRAVGRVAPEDTRVYVINSGVDGFIRETYNDSVGNLVKKNQKLASYYSPEFLSVASGFLAATERVPGSAAKDGARTVPFPGALSKQGVSSLQGYTDRLRNLGMSDVQIQDIADRRQLPENIDVISPAEGFILSRSITRGQHFDHDMVFYRIADLRKVWIVAEISEHEAAHLRPRAPATVTLPNEGKILHARIADSLPVSETGGGTLKLRLEIDNPKFDLRPEMLVDVQLPVTMPAALTLPVDALVDSGASTRVYVERADGIFEPREVQTGWRFDDRVEIRDGVQPGERVVVAATFLVDSESRLQMPSAEPTSTPEEDQAAADPQHTAKKMKYPNCSKSLGPVNYSFHADGCKTPSKNERPGSNNRHQGD